MTAPPAMRCRRITEADFEAVIALLQRGFPERPRDYWASALEMLRGRHPPEGCTKYGYLLEAGSVAVGLHLQIYNTAAEHPGPGIRCQCSAWYVEPDYRSHAALLIGVATRQTSVTYVNTSAAKHTWPILEAVGYHRYSEGQFVAIPALAVRGGGAVSRLDQSPAHRRLADYELLRAHARAGCLALVCDTPDGPRPFVFLRRRLRYAPIGVVQLVYCRDTRDLAACAGPLGRFLLARGVTSVICDADGPIAGLPGLFFAGKNPRFFKGPNRPRLNDLAYSEAVLLEAASRAGRGARPGGAPGTLALAESRLPG